MIDNEIIVEVDVEIDRQTDEVVLISDVSGNKNLTRQAISDFLSLPEGAFIHVDEDWKIHLNLREGATLITDPIDEDLRYEE